MKALILAAGQGTRLRPLTDHRPKPMVVIGNQPMLAHSLRWLRHHNITEIAINLNYRPEVITNYFGDGSQMGVQITYSYEDPVLGTAGAVRKLKDFFQDGPFVVVYGDFLTDLDLTALLDAHAEYRRRDPSTGLTVSLMRVTNPTEVGLVDQTPEGKITRFVEKPDPSQVFTDLANAGVLVVEPSVIEKIPKDTFYDFGIHLFPQLLKSEISLYGWTIAEDAYCLDIGTHEKYRQAQVEWPLRRQFEQAPA
jgi:mannose-1-phosphate guanylyltransferase/phosphomannomutase